MTRSRRCDGVAHARTVLQAAVDHVFDLSTVRRLLLLLGRILTTFYFYYFWGIVEFA